jgi:hypothetical protein
MLLGQFLDLPEKKDFKKTYMPEANPISKSSSIQYGSVII